MIVTFPSENNGPLQEVEWYSDPGEEDEMHSPDGSGSEKEIEAPKHSYIKEDSNMKTMQLMVGLKFKSDQQFRETLRDYCVRNGFDLHYIRNENARIATKCKNETCNWRIHVSPIQEGTTFQIKTVKGEHICARSYVRKLTKAKYLGNRMEKVIRDNPNVPVSTLKNTIMRKCNVDASKWKVIRAKRVALQKILGVDNEQYTRLWDYYETVKARYY
ncbi:UNVERIFIED_CONTAM: hypothetical protein Scaly_2851300 [Sesamum calycinum]|uniref:Transposase MuDR plant domain-containing protein n=1 Tax=Sesamum calycinum TaxID=2727403 RepID=A0AAW2LIF9_9LAMI